MTISVSRCQRPNICNLLEKGLLWTIRLASNQTARHQGVAPTNARQFRSG